MKVASALEGLTLTREGFFEVDSKHSSEVCLWLDIMCLASHYDYTDEAVGIADCSAANQ